MTGSSVAQQIIVGVDTHKDVHVAAAIDGHGRLLGHRSVATSEKGCSDLHHGAALRLQETRQAGAIRSGALHAIPNPRCQ